MLLINDCVCIDLSDNFLLVKNGSGKLYIQFNKLNEKRRIFMSNYEYNKKYAKEWDKKNLKRIGVSLRIEEYEKLKKYCDSNNIAVATFIKSRIADIID